ncbi:hypothetical protein EC973_001157 [Apophysomyces ossiformis]|uniref:Sequence orphan n=1 Tax=Apophysomyces ossiformis TaxID=679940 RepID=A0A8H7BJY4_9FUNG|nr:hypothetical protein EC973_001157 [Apophysomyces ossiformis]
MAETTTTTKDQIVPVNQRMTSHQTLASLYGVDIMAAASSSALVSPFIAIVDRAIIENANGKRKLGQGLIQGFQTLFTQPHKFVGSIQYRLIFGLYFGTYMTANMVETTCEQRSVDHVTSSWIKFLATTAVNMSVCIYKDRAFTRMFGVSAVKPLPLLSYLFFATRDSMTVAASFIAPPIVSKALQEKEWSEDHAKVAAQLSCPAAVQFFSTPLHLLGLDLYNRPAATVGQRAGLIRSLYFKTTLARCARIGPAFGIGGVGNTYFRSYREKILEN